MDVQDLKRRGYTVNVTHNRVFNVPKMGGFALNSRGGSTKVVITSPNGYVAEGTAQCSSNDNYCKRLGRVIAIGRALAEINKNDVAARDLVFEQLEDVYAT